MHYSEKPGMVRVDFFKESGKWYTTEAMDMNDWYNKGYPPTPERATELPHTAVAVRRCLLAHLTPNAGSEPIRYSGMRYVVLEPYHVNAHPVMGDVDELLTLGRP